jgi:toxin-antitoxin system PIN domain toxin
VRAWRLLDVNALIALAWDSHVHHARMRAWFSENGSRGWATCPLTESGFVRVSSNPKVLPIAVGIDAARAVLSALRAHDTHSFLTDDVSITDGDVPTIAGHRQVTDAHLLTLARRHGMRLVTFDAGVSALGQGRDVELLTALQPRQRKARERERDA